MAQIFSPRSNVQAKVIIVATILLVCAGGWLTSAVWWSPYTTYVNVPLDQPVPFSHQHHVVGLGIDCRYCHPAVETASFAGAPATETCMTCHSQLWTEAPLLAPVPASLTANTSLKWNGVYDLHDCARTPEFERWLHAEFPRAAEEWVSEIHRRDFLRLMGASVALAGLGACTKQPLEKIAPYVKQPEQIIAGKPLHFATATTFAGYAQGIVVTSHEGRPTKIEGNPEHPASLGATTVWAQADVLDLYDPDRAQVVTSAGQISTWDD